MSKRGTFAVSRAIKKLDRAAKWLAEARALAAEGTLESLLAYCRVGYTSGNWHLPSIVTKYEHAIKHRLARLLEKQLPKGYHFRKQAGRPQEFILQFKGRHVAELNEYKRTITLWRSFESLEKSLADEIRRSEEHLKECEDRLSRLTEGADKIRRSLSYRVLGLVRLGRLSWIRRSTFEKRIERIIEDAKQQTSSAKDELNRVLSGHPKKEAWLNQFRETWPIVIERLAVYGFKCNAHVMCEFEAE